jgi:hypothetical protein
MAANAPNAEPTNCANELDDGLCAHGAASIGRADANVWMDDKPAAAVLRYFATGITNSAPLEIDAGQRCSTAL